MKKVLTALATVLVIGALVAPASAAYKDEYKLDIVPSIVSAWGQGAQYFADLVKERSGGKINIKVYPNSQLTTGKQTNAFMLLRNGTIDFANQSTINYSPQIPELNLFALPFFFASQPDRYKALDAVTTGKAGKLVAEAIEKKGGKFIAFGENGFRELTNSKREIRKPADIQGLKMRVVGSPLFIDIFKALGANPQTMAWSDTMSAIQQGVIDGQENPTALFYPLKVTDYHKFVTNWHYVADPTLFVANPGVWKSFSPADQELITKAAVDAGKFQSALGRAGLDENDGGKNAAYLATLGKKADSDNWDETLKKAGATVTNLTPEEMKAFVDVTKPVVDAWREKVGADLIKAAEADMASVRK
ncbi:Trap dicarboxylate transporter-dctp subunit [uncultured delta proteobacterium]|uniref:Trap dicarboxylate transporter-dctp subunit n=1 Tax=uncultured delta proteobacterium TaxID=34034 RepID=A0A212JIC4_9DELT|nr:Trap dicarboxylate transporter-dctp subunit [uncultured delta proteobacterium]